MVRVSEISRDCLWLNTHGGRRAARTCADDHRERPRSTRKCRPSVYLGKKTVNLATHCSMPFKTKEYLPYRSTWTNPLSPVRQKDTIERM